MYYSLKIKNGNKKSGVFFITDKWVFPFFGVNGTKVFVVSVHPPKMGKNKVFMARNSHSGNDFYTF